MKNYILVFLLFFNILFTNGQTNNALLIGGEYASLSKGITPSFGFQAYKNSSKVAMGIIIGMAAGPENGYYDGNTNTSAINNSLKEEMKGNSLVSSKFSDMDGGFVFSMEAIPSVIFRTNVSGNTAYGWFTLGVGMKLTRHPAGVGTFLVVSEDAKYEYTEFIDHPFYDGFWDLSPVFQFGIKQLVFAYSPQSVFNKSAIDPTFSLRWAFEL